MPSLRRRRFDPEAEARLLAAAMRQGPAEADAAAVAVYRRAFLGHGDQLGVLEAEACAHSKSRRGGVRRVLAGLLGSSP